MNICKKLLTTSAILMVPMILKAASSDKTTDEISINVCNRHVLHLESKEAVKEFTKQSILQKKNPELYSKLKCLEAEYGFLGNLYENCGKEAACLTDMVYKDDGGVGSRVLHILRLMKNIYLELNK